MRKNDITFEQLRLACKHVDELSNIGVTENLAIRTLELFADVYANVLQGGSPIPHHVELVPKSQWPIKAKELLRQNPNAKPRDNLRVEHGTPRRFRTV